MRAGGFKALFSGVLLSGAMLCNVVALKYTTVAVAVLVAVFVGVYDAVLVAVSEGVKVAVGVSV